MKQKILIADDSVVNLTIMRDILQDAGYEKFSEVHEEVAIIAVTIAITVTLATLTIPQILILKISSLTNSRVFG